MRPQDCTCGWMAQPRRVSPITIEYTCARCGRLWRIRMEEETVPVQRSLEDW